MSDEESGISNRPTQKVREEHDATHVPFSEWFTICIVGRRLTPTPGHKSKIRGSIERANKCDGLITSCK